MQVLNDKILSVRSILTHIELQHLDDRFIFVQNDRIETDLLSDKILELIGGYLSQTFEPGNLHACYEHLDRRIPFLFGITVFGPFFIPYPEERGLQDVQMASADQFGEKLQKEGNKQQPDVHPIHVGIRRNDHFVVAKLIDSLLNVQSCL